MINGSLPEDRALIRLTSEQVAHYSHEVKETIKVSLPPNEEYDERTGALILRQVYQEQTQIWGIFQDGDLDGMVITTFVVEPVTMGRSLMIVALSSFNKLKPETYQRILIELNGFCKKKACSKLTAYSRVPYIIKMAKSLGADTSYKLLSWDIPKPEMTDYTLISREIVGD